MEGITHRIKIKDLRSLTSKILLILWWLVCVLNVYSCFRCEAMFDGHLQKRGVPGADCVIVKILKVNYSSQE